MPELLAFLSQQEYGAVQPEWIFQEEVTKLFEDYVIYGGYPAIVLSRPSLREKRLESLMDTYVEKDVINFLRVGNALQFKKLVRLLALQIGSLLNFSVVVQF